MEPQAARMFGALSWRTVAELTEAPAAEASVTFVPLMALMALMVVARIPVIGEAFGGEGMYAASEPLRSGAGSPQSMNAESWPLRMAASEYGPAPCERHTTQPSAL